MGPPADDDRSSAQSDDAAGADRDGGTADDQSPDGVAPDAADPGPSRAEPAPGQRERSGQTPMDAVASLARDLLVTATVVVLLISLLFGISGVWPPLVAVESDSMEPQIMTGDLVFIMDTDRLSGDGAVDGTGIVPADRGAENGYDSFGRSGDVIIFAPNGNGASTPIIHRAHLWVEAGEDWADRADERLISGSANCEAMDNCPAPHAGFITHGDNNRYYDQQIGQSEPVKPGWIIAKAQLRIPWLGNVRLLVSLLLAPGGAVAGLAVFGARRRSTG